MPFTQCAEMSDMCKPGCTHYQGLDCNCGVGATIEQLTIERDEARRMVAALYAVRYRVGWEEGRSEDEVLSFAVDALTNWGLCPANNPEEFRAAVGVEYERAKTLAAELLDLRGQLERERGRREVATAEVERLAAWKEHATERSIDTIKILADVRLRAAHLTVALRKAFVGMWAYRATERTPEAILRDLPGGLSDRSLEAARRLIAESEGENG